MFRRHGCNCNVLVSRCTGALVRSRQASIGQELKRTLLGYEDARRRAKKHLLEVLVDASSTEAIFNQYIRVWPEHVGAINRATLEDHLNSWWTKKTANRRHIALLGEEGIGKTWATMAWVAKLIHQDRLPLTLPFSCSTRALLDGATIEDTIPDLLVSWTKLATETSGRSD